MYKLFYFVENIPLAFKYPLDFVRWMVEFVKTLAGRHLCQAVSVGEEQCCSFG